MWLSDLSIKRPVFAWVLMFSLLFFGGMAFFGLGINENPDVEFPTVSIRYNYTGATPSVVEKDVIEPVESILVTMQGIRLMTSEAQRDTAQIRLEFDLSQNIDFALQEINTLLSRAQKDLPDSIDPPVVTKSNADDDPILYTSLVSETLSFRELMVLFRDRIRDRISTVDGVAEVRAFGYHEPLLRIDLDAEKLEQYRLTSEDVVASIGREHRELPAGRFETTDQERLLRMMGEAQQVSEFKKMVISRRGGAPNYQRIELQDVAKIYEGTENIRRYSRVNGKPAMGMAIQKQRGVNAVATVEKVKERIAQINKELPEKTQINLTFDTTRFIKESIQELLFTLILSAILTSIVCWVFIGSTSASINVLLAIPTAVVGSFIFLYLFGFTLNTFTVLALALAIGIVVDDAIVMLENIIRYVRLGYDRAEAAVLGSREISFAVIATTIALISIFIPITFLDGLEGRFFFEFAVAISVAVGLSSIEALTLAPMRCAQFLKVEERTTGFGKAFEAIILKISNAYSHYLGKALSWKRSVILIAFAAFGGSLFVLPLIPTELEPAQDKGVLFFIYIAPDGSSLELTDSLIKGFETKIQDIPEIDSLITSVGGFGGGGEANRGNGVAILKPMSERKRSSFEIATEIRKLTKEVKGIQIIVRDRFGSRISGRRGSPIEFTINGPHPETQRELFYALKKKMESDSEILQPRSDDDAYLPEIHIIPDRNKAAARGVEISEIAETISTALGGKTAGQYTFGGRRFDIFVQLQKKDRDSKDIMKKLLVQNNRGEFLPLSEVVSLEETTGPQSIYREDRVRGMRVDASIAEGGNLGSAVKKIQAWAKESFPKDYYVKFSASPSEKLSQAAVIMAFGLLVAYLILAIQFNSFIDPFLVFLAVPFAISGSLLALIVSGQSLNLYSAIGILLTMGIVKKNSILLVEFTNQLRDLGKPIKDALMEACRIRLRPILMTNLSTLAAALPPALAIGPGSETRVPMAISILGGVSVSVVFTIFVVPCFHLWINPKRREQIDPHSIQEKHDETAGKSSLPHSA